MCKTRYGAIIGLAGALLVAGNVMAEEDASAHGQRATDTTETNDAVGSVPIGSAAGTGIASQSATGSVTSSVNAASIAAGTAIGAVEGGTTSTTGTR